MTTAYVWAPGSRIMSSGHGVGQEIAHYVLRASVYRVIFGLPLVLVVGAGVFAALFLIARRRSS